MLTVIIAFWLANLVPGAQSPIPTPWENPVPAWAWEVEAAQARADSAARIAGEEANARFFEEMDARERARCESKAEGIALTLSASHSGDLDLLRKQGVLIEPSDPQALYDLPASCGIALVRYPAEIHASGIKAIATPGPDQFSVVWAWSND